MFKNGDVVRLKETKVEGFHMKGQKYKVVNAKYGTLEMVGGRQDGHNSCWTCGGVWDQFGFEPVEELKLIDISKEYTTKGGGKQIVLNELYDGKVFGRYNDGAGTEWYSINWDEYGVWNQTPGSNLQLVEKPKSEPKYSVGDKVKHDKGKDMVVVRVYTKKDLIRYDCERVTICRSIPENRLKYL